MGYSDWFDAHAEKHRKLVARLVSQGLSKSEIVEYFDFHNMVRMEPDYCPLYRQPGRDGAVGKKCHDLEGLNCFLCACPFFRFDDGGIADFDGKEQRSFCSIESKHGRQGTYGEVIHQDCSKCTVPHRDRFVHRHYDVEWTRIMQKCDLGRRDRGER